MKYKFVWTEIRIVKKKCLKKCSAENSFWVKKRAEIRLLDLRKPQMGVSDASKEAFRLSKRLVRIILYPP